MTDGMKFWINVYWDVNALNVGSREVGCLILIVLNLIKVSKTQAAYFHKTLLHPFLNDTEFWNGMRRFDKLFASNRK